MTIGIRQIREAKPDIVRIIVFFSDTAGFFDSDEIGYLRVIATATDVHVARRFASST